MDLDILVSLKKTEGRL